MKLLWHSNAAWAPTGYGGQTNVFATQRIPALGHEVIISAFYGLHGAPIELDDVLTLPGSKELYGNDVLVGDFEHWGADITITLIDAWVIHPGAAAKIRWCPWFPVDTEPIAPGVANALRQAYQPIAYSQSAVRELQRIGLTCEYVPHGVDTQGFKPVDRQKARESLNCPQDKFLVAIVAANKGAPSRKCFDQQIRAFAEFHKRQPNSLLYIHSDFFGGADGEDIRRIIELSGLPNGIIAEPPPYEFQRGMLGSDYMTRIYSASDVLLNATRGEGFGVPIIEAGACGTPSIVTDFTAMPELVDAIGGWKVAPVDKFFYQNSYQVIPGIDGIVKALEAAYEVRGDVAVREKTRAAVIANYDADYVTATYWKPVLEKIAARIQEDADRRTARAAKRAALRTNGVHVPEPETIKEPGK